MRCCHGLALIAAVENKITPGDRSKQIPSLLEAEPLFSLLSILIEPKIGRRRLRDALAGLCKRQSPYRRKLSAPVNVPFYHTDHHE
jgi:hypothetical protein